MSGAAPPGVPAREALRLWMKVALHSFGGPAGQIAVIHRLVVDEKRWLSERRFLHALSYCMLLPGPEAQQLATYVGWLLHGVRGGLVAGGLFILPGFLTILILSVLYAGFRDVGLVTGLFYGLKPAVIAVVVEAVMRLRRRALTDRTDGVIAGGAFVAIFVFAVAFPLIIVAASLAGLAAQRLHPGTALTAPSAEAPEDTAPTPLPSLTAAARTTAIWLAVWLVPLGAVALFLGPGHMFTQAGVFFAKAATVTFGGAYAVLAYVAQRAVETYHWLAPGEMLDGLGMAETTPGPLIQVVQFVGFVGSFRHPGAFDPMLAGVIGSVITTWVTFAPCFLFIFVGAPFIEYLRGHRLLNAALRGITAAVVGVVLNLAVWFALHTLFGNVRSLAFPGGRLLLPQLATLDWRALCITAAALTAMFRFKVGMMTTLGGAAIAGIVLHAPF